jgi:beta-lactam-binding protein with PASTA domain
MTWSEEESEPVRSPDGRVTVPDVAGLPARVAVRNLHRWGLRTAEVGWGEVVGTVPGPGSFVAPGDTIRLRYRGQAHD